MECYRETYYNCKDRTLISVKDLLKELVNGLMFDVPAIGIEKSYRYETDGKTIYSGETPIDEVNIVIFYKYYTDTDIISARVETKFFDKLDNDKKMDFLSLSFFNTFGRNGLSRMKDYDWYLLGDKEVVKFDMARDLV